MESAAAIGVIGFIVGVMVGMTGVGGGALTTPVLIFWVGVRPVVAVGTDLFFLALLKVVAAWTHHRWGNVDWRLVRLLALGSIPGSLLGVAALSLLRNIAEASVDAFITRLLGLVLVAAAVAILSQLFLGNRARRIRLPGIVGGDASGAPSPQATVALGFLVGPLVSLTSVGGGSLIVAAMVLFFRLSGRQVVGTDLAHALILSSVATLGHVGIGTVNVPLAMNLLVGAIPGVLLGSRVTLKVPEQGLRAVLGSVLLLAGIMTAI